jgi:hypothetical protein
MGSTEAEALTSLVLGELLQALATKTLHAESKPSAIIEVFSATELAETLRSAQHKDVLQQPVATDAVHFTADSIMSVPIASQQRRANKQLSLSAGCCGAGEETSSSLAAVDGVNDAAEDGGLTSSAMMSTSQAALAKTLAADSPRSSGCLSEGGFMANTPMLVRS